MADSRLDFSFRRYRLALRHVVRTAHEAWTEREGLLLRVENDQGDVGFGEVAPIPAFGTETVAKAEEVCRTLGDRIDAGTMTQVAEDLGCVRSGLSAAFDDLARRARPEDTASADTAAAYRAVAALLPAGPAALREVVAKSESGFRVFKWKVGVGDVGDELACLDDLCAALPSGAKLRLDANGAWDRRRAERWLERCAERPIEFVEQPCFAPKTETEIARRRADELLLGLANEYPTPIALDESIVGAGDVERWLGIGWPGWFVVKPSLLGNATAALELLRTARAAVVFSSALETAVGARAALRIAFAWPGEAKALGFGVWPLFVDGRFDGPSAAPFIRANDVERLNVEELWKALS
jgi:o-succinylbenzoate synthase